MRNIKDLLVFSLLAAVLAGACGGDTESAPGGPGAGGSAGSGGLAGSAGATPYQGNCLAPPRPARPVAVGLEPVFAGVPLSQPLLLLQPPGDGTRSYVVEQSGRIKLVSGANPGSATIFADLTKRIEASSPEGGLLGMAFHPNFAQNRQIFLSFTDKGPNGLRSVIARYESADGQALDLSSEKIILTIDQPFANHNGGMIAFGPDGYLYAGYGDGGSGGDPLGSGQKLDTLLGKFLRIDIDKGDPYAIPPGNPFAAGGGRGEIFAWGVRNPWRFSFDRATGDLWAGDVGQDIYEEIDVIKAGGNYGWNTMEGFHCYAPATNCDQSGLVLPVVEYPHAEGKSVTGGFVYRGKAIPALVGSYLYADFASGRLWRVVNDPQTGAPKPELLLETGLAVSSFGEDVDGELYLVGYTPGSISRLVATAAQAPTAFPQKLSETGCFDPGDPTRPAAALVPYEVNAPFWSDGAEKKRWVSLPPGGTIAVDSAGDMELPVGSVVVKEFTLGGKRIETRLLVRHDDGGWAGYSYEWDDQQKDATLLPAAKNKVIGDQTWHYPGGAECLICHTPAAGRTLGLEVAQLNRDVTVDGQPTPQLSRFAALGMLAAPAPDPATAPRLSPPFGMEDLDSRARSYLHTNCSFCHRPEGTGRGPADFRFSTSLADAHVCGVTPEEGDLGVPGAQLVSPGSPSTSVVSMRVHRRDAKGMPPLSSMLVDEEGAALLDAWISGLNGCP